MGKIVKFRRRRKPRLPKEWSGYRSRVKSRTGMTLAVAGLLIGGGVGVGIISTSPALVANPAQWVGTINSPPSSRTFAFCHTGGGTNCVVDGDTIWMDGTKIRVADIDAPETHPPRCAREADLGSRATDRLLELVNAGPFMAEVSGGRDEDRYGRKLRVLTRDGQSLGAILVSEGLARAWDGRRHPWC